MNPDPERALPPLDQEFGDTLDYIALVLQDRYGDEVFGEGRVYDLIADRVRAYALEAIRQSRPTGWGSPGPIADGG